MNITSRKPFTPGEILHEEFMIPYELTQTRLAELIRVERRRINEIIKGKRAITTDTAIRLGKLFRMTPQFWLNLQLKLDVWESLHHVEKKEQYEKIKPFSLVSGTTQQEELR